MLGLNDLLLRTGLDAEQRRLADGIRTSGQMLLSLINDILDFRKIEAGRVELEQIDFDLRAVLDQVAGPIAGVAAAKGLDLTSRRRRRSRPCYGDPTRVRQVFANLLTNAVKFTESGERRTRRVRAHRLGDVWRLTVRRRGHRASASTRRMHRRCSRRSGRPTRRRPGRFGGTGLGLAISRELSQAMGGNVG